MSLLNIIHPSQGGWTKEQYYYSHPTCRGNISVQTNSRISAKPKIRVLARFKAQDLKIGSFVK